jgi:hypothetical protein
MDLLPLDLINNFLNSGHVRPFQRKFSAYALSGFHHMGICDPLNGIWALPHKHGLGRHSRSTGPYISKPSINHFPFYPGGKSYRFFAIFTSNPSPGIMVKSSAAASRTNH